MITWTETSPCRTLLVDPSGVMKDLFAGYCPNLEHTRFHVCAFQAYAFAWAKNKPFELAVVTLEDEWNSKKGFSLAWSIRESERQFHRKTLPIVIVSHAAIRVPEGLDTVHPWTKPTNALVAQQLVDTFFPTRER